MSTAKHCDAIFEGVVVFDTPVDEYEQLKIISYANTKKFIPSIDTNLRCIVESRRLMTSLAGSFDDSDCIFVVSHDSKGNTALFDLFCSNHILSVVYDTMRLVYHQSTLRLLRVSPKPELTQEQRDLLADRSVAIFVFCETTGKLLVAVSKATMRRIALQFLELNTKGQHVTDDNTKT